ncbi:MAG: hypothetical protein IH616_16695, partial [Gemmatimonadales bacterium]|nr:hypothetical protein [Gemmatimonadales bacterium]
MGSTRVRKPVSLLCAATLALMVGSALAQTQAPRKEVTQPEIRYQAGGSPLG